MPVVTTADKKLLCSSESELPPTTGNVANKADPAIAHRKQCTICHTLRPVLVRCQIDSSGVWDFVCPGKCWKNVSGGEIDGDGRHEHRWYRYGGMWKNKHEGVSAKKPKKKKTPAAHSKVTSGEEEEKGPSLAESGAEEEGGEQSKVVPAPKPRKPTGRDRFFKNDHTDWDEDIEDQSAD